MAEWNREGIPHKGWQCLDVIDLGEDLGHYETIPYEQCEMCGNEKIRYAHIMSHPDYPGELHVGCICAEKMTNDYVNPRKCETALKNKASRRCNFNKQQRRLNPAKRTYSKNVRASTLRLWKAGMVIGECFSLTIEYGNMEGKRYVHWKTREE